MMYSKNLIRNHHYRSKTEKLAKFVMYLGVVTLVLYPGIAIFSIKESYDDY